MLHCYQFRLRTAQDYLSFGGENSFHKLVDKSISEMDRNRSVIDDPEYDSYVSVSHACVVHYSSDDSNFLVRYTLQPRFLQKRIKLIHSR